MGTTLKGYESQAVGPYFLDYMTIVDFFIYEVVHIMNKVMPEQVQEFPKLCQIHQKMASLPAISNYEKSKRAIQNHCPIDFFEQWKKSAYGSAN